jgi:hypothetical protein
VAMHMRRDVSMLPTCLSCACARGAEKDPDPILRLHAAHSLTVRAIEAEEEASSTTRRPEKHWKASGRNARLER